MSGGGCGASGGGGGGDDDDVNDVGEFWFSVVNKRHDFDHAVININRIVSLIEVARGYVELAVALRDVLL